MGCGSSSPRVGSPGGSSADSRFREALEGIRLGEVPNAMLTGQRLGPPEIEELCRALSCTESVKALELDSNMIGHKGVAHLAEALAGDSNISLVDLTDNGIGDAGAAALADRLGGNCALRHLDLARNTIQGAGGLALGRMLTVNSGIRQLTLSENMLGVEGARAIGSALPSNLSLMILNLRKCGLGPKGARFIAQGLNSTHAVVRELSVGLNGIKDKGAAEFAEMIRVNRSIKEFYLDDNGIKGFGAESMAEALRNNDCLETFWMVNNSMSVDVVAKLARAGAQHKALRLLGIACTGDLPAAVVQDLQVLQKRFIARKLERSFHGTCQDSRGNGNSRDVEVAGLDSPGPREARDEGVQEIIVWDDGFQVEELLEMSGLCESHNLLRQVRPSRGVPTVNLSDGVGIDDIVQIAEEH